MSSIQPDQQTYGQIIFSMVIEYLTVEEIKVLNECDENMGVAQNNAVALISKLNDTKPLVQNKMSKRSIISKNLETEVAVQNSSSHAQSKRMDGLTNSDSTSRKDYQSIEKNGSNIPDSTVFRDAQPKDVDESKHCSLEDLSNSDIPSKGINDISQITNQNVVRRTLSKQTHELSKDEEGLTWRENKLGTTASPAGSMTKTEVQDSGPSSTEVSDITMNGQPVVPSPQKWERKGEVPVSPLKEVPECDSKLTWPEPYDQEVSFRLEERIGESDRFDVRRELLHTKQLLVLSLTWNQQAKQGPLAEELQNKLLPMNRYHLISVGTQECENGFAKSLVVTSKKNWETVLQEALGNNYFKVCAHTLQASHLIVFAHKALRQWISAVSSAAVATGVGNRLGNKGGIGIRMCLGSTQLLVVNSHLAAHQGKTNERNSQYNRIAHDLHRTFTGRPVSENQNPLIDEYDLVIWGGDLNYRIDSTREVVDACLEKNMHEVLLEYDELRQCMDRKSCFQGYAEGPLNFRPTYKFDKDADVYDTSPKMRIPSWTDRILYKKNSGMKLMCYKSVPDLRISDHRPVCASFSCPLQGLSDANYPAVYQASHSQIRRQSLQPKNKSEVCSIQ